MSNLVKVVNITKQRTILEQVAVASGLSARLNGLLGYKSPSYHKGLLIKPCRSVHTSRMKSPIDVGFVDSQGRICHMISRMRPQKLSLTVNRAAYVIEAPAGTFLQTDTREGDIVALEPTNIFRKRERCYEAPYKSYKITEDGE